MTTYNAPPVVYPIGASRFQCMAMLGLWILGLVMVSVWVLMTGKQDWRTGLMFSAVLGAGAAAHRSWKHTPVGQLEWTGEVWRWESASYQTGIAEQQLFVVVDFQHRLLLRLENQAHLSLWIWAERLAFSERWLDLRRAVYATHKESTVSMRQKFEPAVPLSSGSGLANAGPVDGAPLKP